MTLTNLPDGKSYVLDTMVFVYFLETHRDFFSRVKKLFQRIEAGEIQAVISSLVFAELLVPVYRKKDVARADTIFRLLSNFPNMEIVSVTPEISRQAAQIRASHSIPTPDAIHAATAISVKADGIITNDKEFQKLQKSVDVIPLA